MFQSRKERMSDLEKALRVDINNAIENANELSLYFKKGIIPPYAWWYDSDWLDERLHIGVLYQKRIRRESRELRILKNWKPFNF